jgi:threonine/homoserine/homoserine lactone efflux protein
MPPFDTTLAFFAASVVLALAPGPDNVFVLLHAASHGRGAGMLAVLGLCSVLMNVSNPKVAIFLVAFLPQFTNLAHGNMVLQICFLGSLFMLASGWCLAQSRAERRWRPNRFASVAFVALALRLAFG